VWGMLELAIRAELGPSFVFVLLPYSYPPYLYALSTSIDSALAV